MSNQSCQDPFENIVVSLGRPLNWQQHLCNECEQFSKNKKRGTILTLQQFLNCGVWMKKWLEKLLYNVFQWLSCVCIYRCFYTGSTVIWAYGNLDPVSEADTFNIFLEKKISCPAFRALEVCVIMLFCGGINLFVVQVKMLNFILMIYK